MDPIFFEKYGPLMRLFRKIFMTSKVKLFHIIAEW